ncbi:MAG: hypothetical protein ACMUIE_07030 [Thermoplasmatota archaeon]
MAGMTRMIRTDNSLYSLQMRCFYISSDYKPLQSSLGKEYLKDIFED